MKTIKIYNSNEFIRRNEMKHTINELKQKQAMPLEAKIIMSQIRIKDWYDYFNGNVYVSFSGGKDSTVLKHLVETTIGVYNVPSVFVNTGLEFPEIQKFAKSQPNVEVIHPKMRFDEVVKKYGYPIVSKMISFRVYYARRAIAEGRENESTNYKALCGNLKDNNGNPSLFNCEKWGYLINSDFKISNKCCNVMKKSPLHEYERTTGRKPIIGTMASESQNRKSAWLVTGCNAFDSKNPISKPLSFWTEQDILKYIKKFNLPYCPVYGDIVELENGQLATTGEQRTGCIFCMYGCHLENRYENRFQRLQKTHPRQYEYCIKGGEYINGIWQPSKEGLGLNHVLETIGVEYRREPTLFDM